MNKPVVNIITPLEEEFYLLHDSISKPVQEKYAGITFISGLLIDVPVVVARSGVGKVNAALAAQIMIDRFDADRLILLGVGGVINSNLHIGDVVISKDVRYHDVDAIGLGFALGEIPFLGVNTFEADQTLVEKAQQASIQSLFKLKYRYAAMGESYNHIPKVVVGTVITGDQFISGAGKKKQLIKSFNGDCVDMEGAAVAQTAYLNNRQFVIIRALSDECENDAEKDYYDFLNTIAPYLLFEIAVNMAGDLKVTTIH
ncbi:MAG: 5'-methylthioadenosine/adenosylhomocysteine nucleosidase [Dehalococcoidales bacterium]|jgi:adenosylhomocysteine nucleosidase|nr:5'-methylthioadenosine/adenosylhomocysteine nucleosidase [Dehalococcoidales bacterium]